MSTGGPSQQTPARIHLDRGATWRATESLYLAAKVDPAGQEVATANLYRFFGRRQPDWYEDQFKALNGALVGERDLPGFAVRSVLDPAWGAVYDGTTDCADAFNLALQQVAGEGGGFVIVPPVENVASQRYMLASTVVIPAGVTLVGCGPRSIVRCEGGIAGFSFESGFARSGLRDLVILGNDLGPSGAGVSLVESQFVELARLQIWDFEVGIDVSDGTPFSAYNRIDHCEVNRSTVAGIRIHQSSNGVVIVGGRVFYTFDQANGGIAIDVQDSRGVAILGVSLEAYDFGLRLAGAASGSMHGSWMEKGANGAPGTDRHDFLIDAFVESPFFEGDFHFAGNHTTDVCPIVTSCTRLAADRSTPVQASDFALNAQLGSTASVVVTAGSNEHRGEISVTAGGTGIVSGQRITFTCPDGAWSSAPWTMCSRNGGDSPGFLDADDMVITDSTSGFTIDLQPVLADGDTLVIRYMRLG